jgi:hypothetical protein
MFRHDGKVYDMTYPEIRALRKHAISVKDTGLADVCKGLLQDVSGDWIETNAGAFLRTGNRNSQLGRAYGRSPEERKRAPKPAREHGPVQARPAGAVVLRKAV